MSLCAKHHVTCSLSDEIHCDITNPQKRNIFLLLLFQEQIVAQNTIMCIAPTKAFNMAGMQTAACIVVPNEVYKT